MDTNITRSLLINQKSKVLAEFMLMTHDDVTYIKKLYDINTQGHNSLSRTKARLLFDQISYQIFDNILDAHVQLNEHSFSAEPYLCFDDFFQILCIYGFFPLPVVMKFYIASVGLDIERPFTKKNCITFFSNILPQAASKRAKSYLENLNGVDYIPLSDVIEIINSHKSLSSPFSELQNSIKNKIIMKDRYESIYFRYKNRNDILTYYTLHNSYPPLPCSKRISVFFHLIQNPYDFDYSGSDQKDINLLITEIYKKNLKRRKVMRNGSAFHNSIVRLKRIGSTHTDGSSFLKINQSNRQTSTFSTNNENSLISHSVSRDTNNTDTLHTMMMESIMNNTTATTNSNYNLNRMNNNNNNYYNNYTLTQHTNNVSKYDRKRSVGSPSPLQQEMTESINKTEEESDDSSNKNTSRCVNKIQVSFNSKKLSVGQVVPLSPIPLKNSIPSSSKIGESYSTTQHANSSCLSQDIAHTLNNGGVVV